MNTHKKQLILITILTTILLLSGCTQPKKTTTNPTQLPNISISTIQTLQQHSLTWIQQHVNKTTGLLNNHTINITLTDQLLTGHLLTTTKKTNTTQQTLLQQNINNLLQIYTNNPNSFNLTTTSLLLTLLHKNPDISFNHSLPHNLTTHLLSYQQEKSYFNTTPLLSNTAAYALNALTLHANNTENKTIQTKITTLFSFYQELIKKQPTHIYYQPWFTQAFSTQLLSNQSTKSYQMITLINTRLTQQQQTTNNTILGQYSPEQKPSTIRFQIQSTQSMQNAYTKAQQQSDTHNTSSFKQSLILGLIYLKHTILNQNTTLTPRQHLTLLPLLSQTQELFSKTNWTYFWEPTTQTLIEKKTLQTSPQLWTALTIGVMGSIGLLSLVFIIIGLYYKNQS